MSSYPPLKDRFLRSTGSHSSPQPLPPARPTKYKHWTEERLRLAYEAVSNEKLSVREAADAFDVRQSCLIWDTFSLLELITSEHLELANSSYCTPVGLLLY